jgi:hypothetical protein
MSSAIPEPTPTVATMNAQINAQMKRGIPSFEVWISFM